MPRYAMPALVPACWLLAMTLAAPNAAWPRWIGGKPFSLRDRQRAVTALAILVCAGVGVYAAAIIPKMHRRQNLQQLAAQIDAAVPRSKPVYALDPNYQPIFFYTRSKLIYASKIGDVPTDAIYLLVRPEREEEVLESNRWAPRRPHRMVRMTDYRKESILLLRID
jgi:hypothetical protein